jgi:hypothetical protein
MLGSCEMVPVRSARSVPLLLGRVTCVSFLVVNRSAARAAAVATFCRLISSPSSPCLVNRSSSARPPPWPRPARRLAVFGVGFATSRRYAACSRVARSLSESASPSTRQRRCSRRHGAGAIAMPKPTFISVRQGEYWDQAPACRRRRCPSPGSPAASDRRIARVARISGGGGPDAASANAVLAG